VTGVPQACPEALAQCGNSVSRAGARVAMPVAGGKALTGSSVAELRNQLRKLNQSTRGSKEELLQRIASERASGAAVGAKQKREGSVLKEGEGQGPRLFQRALLGACAP
jgi:hypothetical protein